MDEGGRRGQESEAAGMEEAGSEKRCAAVFEMEGGATSNHI